MKKSLLFLTFSLGLLLAGCGSGNSGSTSTTNNNTLAAQGQNVAESNVKSPSQVVDNNLLKASTHLMSANLNDDAPSTYANPINGLLVSAVDSAIKGDIGGLVTTGANDLLSLMGIGSLDPAAAEFAQVESQLAGIQQSIDQLNTKLQGFIDTYDNNINNAYTETFSEMAVEIQGNYTNLAQDIYNNSPLETSGASMISEWEAGVIPSIPAETAALSESEHILSKYADFPAKLSREISMLSDDTGDSYLDNNGNLNIYQNSDGTWGSNRTPSTPYPTAFIDSLNASYNAYIQAYPPYPAAGQNLLLNKAQLSQMIMAELFSDTVSLQRTYRMLDFFVAAKFNQPAFKDIDLPSFMGNPTSYAQAHDELVKIYLYKTSRIYLEAQTVINQYSTGQAGSDLSDFIIPANCDSPLSSLAGGATGQVMTLAILQAQSSNYAWDGSSLTTVCKNNAGNAWKATTQNVKGLCGSGQLINLNGNLYCALNSPTFNANLYNQTYPLQNLHDGVNITPATTTGTDFENWSDSVSIPFLPDTYVANWGDSNGHLRQLNDFYPTVHLWDGDPTNNYHIVLGNQNNLYIYVENNDLTISCIPNDSYCSGVNTYAYNNAADALYFKGSFPRDVFGATAYTNYTFSVNMADVGNAVNTYETPVQ